MKSPTNDLFFLVSSLRPGSFEEASTCAQLASRAGLSSQVLDCTSVSGLAFLLKNRNVKGRCCRGKLVIWNISRFALLYIATARLLRYKILYLRHEPGGFMQRFHKGDSFIYSVATTLLEKAIGTFANENMTPNRRNSEKYGMHYAPLVFEAVAPHYRHGKNRDTVLHLGRIDARRNSNLIKSMKEQRDLLSYRIRFFPHDFDSTSEKAKLGALAQSLCVINVYSVKYNQSGVTFDSLRSGVPVVVSCLDPLCTEIANSRCGVVVDHNGDIRRQIIDAVGEISRDFEEMSGNAIRLADREFGSRAFDRWWYPLLKA